MWKLWALALLIFSQPVAAQDIRRGTAIAAFRTSKEIVIAADSKSVDASSTPYPEKICKIRKAGDIYFALNGLVEENHWFRSL